MKTHRLSDSSCQCTSHELLTCASDSRPSQDSTSCRTGIGGRRMEIRSLEQMPRQFDRCSHVPVVSLSQMLLLEWNWWPW